MEGGSPPDTTRALRIALSDLSAADCVGGGEIPFYYVLYYYIVQRVGIHKSSILWAY